MILDKEVAFSNPQTVTTDTNTGLISTSKVDLATAGRDIGAGENLYIVSTVTTALDMDASQALDVTLVTDETSAISSVTVVQTLGSFAANAAAGSRIIARIQPSASFKRWIAIQYKTSTGNALSAGAVKTAIAKDVDAYTNYPRGYVLKTS